MSGFWPSTWPARRFQEYDHELRNEQWMRDGQMQQLPSLADLRMRPRSPITPPPAPPPPVRRYYKVTVEQKRRPGMAQVYDLPEPTYPDREVALNADRPDDPDGSSEPFATVYGVVAMTSEPSSAAEYNDHVLNVMFDASNVRTERITATDLPEKIRERWEAPKRWMDDENDPDEYETYHRKEAFLFSADTVLPLWTGSVIEPDYGVLDSKGATALIFWARDMLQGETPEPGHAPRPQAWQNSASQWY